jgi:hypothetical protein
MHFSVDSCNENLPEKRIPRICAFERAVITASLAGVVAREALALCADLATPLNGCGGTTIAAGAFLY